MRVRCEVAVIGAGPAGTFAALKLSSLGHRVVMIDPCEHKKVCAGILTAQYVRKYATDEVFIEREVKGIKISFRDIMAEITYRHAVEYSINRELYDSFNLNEALAAGSMLIKDRAVSIQEKGSLLVIRAKREDILADYAIVAAGVSDFSRLCGGSKKYAYCVQQKRDLKPGDYFEMELQNGGYSWIAPKKDHVLAGSSSLEGYPEIIGEKGLIPAGGPVRDTFSSRFLLAGDAAGFVSPFEGEGIYYSRRSGEIAAGIVSSAITSGNTLDEYEKCWKKEFDFSLLTMISRALTNERILEAFVKEIRDNERFNKLVEDILTKRNTGKPKDIYPKIKELVG